MSATYKPLAGSAAGDAEVAGVGAGELGPAATAEGQGAADDSDARAAASGADAQQGSMRKSSTMLPEPDETEAAIEAIGTTLEEIEARQREPVTDTARLARLRKAVEALQERLDQAEDRDKMARWRGRSKKSMSRAEMVECISQVGSRRFLELPD
jgi:hypothetical protein